MHIEDLILSLHAIGAFQTGTFQLKSGLSSPFYIDLRVIISYPDILKAIADFMWESIKDHPFDLLCGVPYTALPIATAISLKSHTPMLMRRKEIKEYGTKKTIEGVFEKGQKCYVIEDLVTSGISSLETIQALEMEGLKMAGVAAVVDREQGGKKNLESKGYSFQSLFTLSTMVSVLEAHQKINTQTANAIRAYIENTSVGVL